MPENRPTPSEPAPLTDPEPGLVDPRTIHPGPEDDPPGTRVPPESGTQTDRGPTPQTAQPEPGAPGLVDPRTEIPGPFGH
jgi:hypothetical protein